jgi:hypothetical protein
LSCARFLKCVKNILQRTNCSEHSVASGLKRLTSECEALYAVSAKCHEQAIAEVVCSGISLSPTHKPTAIETVQQTLHPTLYPTPHPTPYPTPTLVCPSGFGASTNDVQDGTFNVNNQNIGTILACGELCNRDDACAMFEYKTADNRCKISSGALNGDTQFPTWQSCIKATSLV